MYINLLLMGYTMALQKQIYYYGCRINGCAFTTKQSDALVQLWTRLNKNINAHIFISTQLHWDRQVHSERNK